jgi:hypothetical protein
MIVRAAGDAVHLITQPDHAALSRRIMDHWRPLADEPRRASILHAIGEHDNGWREADREPALDREGRFVDFVAAPAEGKQAVWPRGVARLAFDAWAAALVAQHAIAVYDRYHADSAWVAFFSEMERARDGLVEAAGLTLDELLGDYVFVRLGDLISLTFCAGWADEQVYDRWRVRLAGDSDLTVEPFEFDAEEFALEVDAVELRGGPFTSSEGLRAALAGAHGVTVRGRIESLL